MMLDRILFSIDKHGRRLHGLLNAMIIPPVSVIPYILAHGFSIVVAVCVCTVTHYILEFKALVNIALSKHSVQRSHHLPRNVKLAHGFAKQHTCFLEAHEVVFVSEAINNECNEIAWQVANVDSASFAHHHCSFRLSLFACAFRLRFSLALFACAFRLRFSLVAFLLSLFCPDYK